MTQAMLDDEVQEYFRIVYFGDPGTAKTTSMMGMAHLGRVVVFDADRGLKARALRQHGIPTENIEVHQDLTYPAIERKLFEIAGRLDETPGSVVGISFDTVTNLLPHWLDPISQREAKRLQAKGEAVSDFFVSLDSRGEISTMFRRLQRQFLALPCHVLIGAHVRRDTDKQDGAVRIGPALPPALQQEALGLYDCVLMCQTTEFPGMELPEISALTQRSGKYIAKDRFHLLPKTLINPTFDRVLGYIDGTLVNTEDPLQLEAKIRRFAQAEPEPVAPDGAVFV